MKPRIFFLAVGLVAVLLASCAPQATQPPAAPIEASSPVSVPATAAPADSSALEATVASPTQAVEIQAAATSRGPNLEATDPTTVNLASGQLQLVEFFRFT